MNTAIVINKDTMGHGEREIGELLIGAFLKKLWAKKKKPEYIVLYNSGVKLIGKGSMVLDAMDGLEEAGVEIIACGTCLDYYHIDADLKVGRRSDMVEIVDIMTSAKRTITI